MASLIGQWYIYINGLIRGGKTFKDVYNLAIGLAINICGC